MVVVIVATAAQDCQDNQDQDQPVRIGKKLQIRRKALFEGAQPGKCPYADVMRKVTEIAKTKKRDLEIRAEILPHHHQHHNMPKGSTSSFLMANKTKHEEGSTYIFENGPALMCI